MKSRPNDIIKKLMLAAIDVIFILASLFFAYYITKKKVPDAFSVPVLIWFIGNVIIGILVFALSGLYSIIFESVSIVDALRLCFAIICILVVNIIYVSLIDNIKIGISTSFVYCSFLFFLTGMTRFYKRAFIVGKYYVRSSSIRKKKVMIVGAGKACAALINEMFTSNKMEYLPVCIIDDDVEKIGKSISGVKIVGSTYQIKKFAKKYGVEEIFITMPSVDRHRQSKIIARCNDAGCPVKVLPGMYQLADGQVSVSKMRHVDIQDLLGREPVTVDINEIIGYIEGKVVLVTGGGGSIGSELCRQIATHKPERLIIIDKYENKAY